MSFVVLGVDFPTTCWDCPCCRVDEGNKYCTAYECKAIAIPGDRPDWCPLRPMPDNHGNLIDRDAVPRFGGRKGLVHSADLDAMPVIVMAEGEGENDV